MEVTFTPGDVQVHTVWLVADYPDLKMIEVDLLDAVTATDLVIDHDYVYRADNTLSIVFHLGAHVSRPITTVQVNGLPINHDRYEWFALSQVAHFTAYLIIRREATDVSTLVYELPKDDVALNLEY